MAYLSWRDKTVSASLEGKSLALALGSEQRAELVTELAPIFSPEGASELRIDVSDEWILFWKAREGESRLLLARPAENQWVGTIALELEHGRRLVERLGALQSGPGFSLGELGSFSSVSNLEIRVSLQ